MNVIFLDFDGVLDTAHYNSLEDKTSKYIVPLGIDKDLEKFGISKNKIQKMNGGKKLNSCFNYQIFRDWIN